MFGKHVGNTGINLLNIFSKIGRYIAKFFGDLFTDVFNSIYNQQIDQKSARNVILGFFVSLVLPVQLFEVIVHIKIMIFQKIRLRL